MKKCSIAIFFLIFSIPAICQTTETQAWLFITHQQKLNSKWKVLADIQTRTADKMHYLNTLLLRTALMYEFKKDASVALGYAYLGDWEREGNQKTHTFENRIFEQYLYEFKLNRMEMMFRGRLEQRWLANEQNTDFAQRLRAFSSAQIPISGNNEFTKGAYIGIQDEIFLNVTNKRYVNRSFFDQNRTFVSLGYRWNKSVDTELGYQYWYQKEMDGNYKRHVIQFQITTNF